MLPTVQFRGLTVTRLLIGVNVGMHRGDRDDMVEANAALAREILQPPTAG